VIEASLLGYRITIKFVHHFLGRIFNNPDAVFTKEMLRPELQDKETFVESLRNLSITQKRVAEGLMTDGTYEALCPPLQALVSIMVNGEYKGKDREHPDVRQLFTREYVLNSDWYRHRLKVKQERDIRFWNQTITYLEDALSRENLKEAAQKLGLEAKLKAARKELIHVESDAYIDELFGTLGADPLK
jgi:hypothetical protein